MVEWMDKKDIIRYKEDGKSNREVMKLTGVDRRIVSKYWEEYKRNLAELSKSGTDKKAIQDRIFAEPKYKSTGRKKRKYSEEQRSFEKYTETESDI